VLQIPDRIVIIIAWPASLVVLALLLLGYLFKNPEKLSEWRALVGAALSAYSERAERIAVADDIHARVNRFQRQIQSEQWGVMPHRIKIEFVKESAREAFIADGEVVVKMKRHINRDENIVAALMLYMSKGLIPQARRHLEPVFLKSVDFTVIRKILSRERLVSAVDHFDQRIAKPAMQDEPVVKIYCTSMEKLDDHGLFSRILLRELMDVGRELHLRMPDDAVTEDAADLIRFLETIVDKEREEDVPLEFIGRRLRIRIILVARRGKLRYEGLQPYLKRIEEAIALRVNAIYICARGMNIAGARRIASTAVSRGWLTPGPVHSYTIYSPDGSPVEAICIPCRVAR